MDATLSLSAVTAKAQQGVLALKMASQQQKAVADMVDAASQAVGSATAAPTAPASADGKGGVVNILA